MQERLQKILSLRGIASRRKAEEYIEQGLVKVNGKVAKIGQKADPEKDRIEVDGKVIEARKEMLYYVMHKPVGVVTENVDRSSFSRQTNKTNNDKTNNESATISVRDILPPHLRGKVFPVGRLDKATSGLLLFTNDGVLAYRLTHPKFYHEKEYEVRVERPIEDGALHKLAHGFIILGTRTKPAKVKRISGRRFSIALTEGKNRQIRRMCKKIGHPVTELMRTRIVTLTDSELGEGRVRVLSEQERDELLQAVGL